MTKLNKSILDMVNKSSGHLTAKEAFVLAKEKKIKVSLASIYRILGKLAEEGYISRYAVSGSPDFFDKTVTRHEHLICSKCGKVQDIHIKDLKKTLSKKAGIDIDSYELSIKYICDECKKNKK